MIIDTPTGPKYEWEVDEETVVAAIREAANSPEEAEEQLAARRGAKLEAEANYEQWSNARAAAQVPSPSAAPATVFDPDIVPLAERGDVAALTARLAAGCSPDVVAHELLLFPGGERMYCNEWTPLSVAAVEGQAPAVKALLAARADPDVVCCACNSSGAYRFWTALDCARTGDTVPCERDPQRHLQPRHGEAEKLLLQAGAKPASALPEPPRMTTYGYKASDAPRRNPCLDEDGQPLRPPHLFDAQTEAERKLHPGAPKTRLGVGGSGCPMTSMGMPTGKPAEKTERVYCGGCRVQK